MRIHFLEFSYSCSNFISFILFLALPTDKFESNQDLRCSKNYWPYFRIFKELPSSSPTLLI